MRNFRGIFPGMFTMGNLFCGYLSILSSMALGAKQREYACAERAKNLTCL